MRVGGAGIGFGKILERVWAGRVFGGRRLGSCTHRARYPKRCVGGGEEKIVRLVEIS